MKYISVCSGIAADHQAFPAYGWECKLFSEIDPYASAVLKHHYPNITNIGDFTKYEKYDTIDLVIGGTPCQSFSNAGKRKGLDSANGQLMLKFVEFCSKREARWIIWENVPGALSQDRGRAFGHLLGLLAKHGYGFAYRILDSQWVRTQQFPFAVPQQRRRVFLVGYLGDWKPPAAVLFEQESLYRLPPPRRSLRVVNTPFPDEGYIEGYRDIAEKNGTINQKLWSFNNLAFVNRKNFKLGGYGDSACYNDLGASYTLTTAPGHGMYIPIKNSLDFILRKFTPLEYERLQGFPDNFTRIEYNGKIMSDSQRYKMLGNSIAVNCLSWLGGRIQLVQEVLNERKDNE